jgi:hypothetical protein
MNANDDTPCNGENVSDESIDYQQLGQRLLCQELERHAYAVREEFVEESVAVDHGAGLNGTDVAELEEALRQAQFLVEDLRESLE